MDLFSQELENTTIRTRKKRLQLNKAINIIECQQGLGHVIQAWQVEPDQIGISLNDRPTGGLIIRRDAVNLLPG